MTEKIFRQTNDEALQAAIVRAKKTFKYYWRELSWESRRIIPGLDMNAVKVPIRTNVVDSKAPPYEHMWFQNIDYDGKTISGDLINRPSWVKQIKQGQRIEFALEEISDWMYAIEGRVYGGFTVQEMRKKLDKVSLKQHDKAWGLDFGDPDVIYVAPKQTRKGGVFGWGSRKDGYLENDEIPEHPMSINMAEKCEKGIKENPKAFLEPNDNGSTMLHFDALAGNLIQVKILLKYGADTKMKNKAGLTPRDLAEVLMWDKILAVL